MEVKLRIKELRGIAEHTETETTLTPEQKAMAD